MNNNDDNELLNTYPLLYPSGGEVSIYQKTIEKLYFFDYYDKYLCTLFNDILVYAPKVHETLNDDSK
jgi:hypothetical protein